MLALITGQGALPAAVAAACAERPVICALEGHAPEGLQTDLTFRIEHLGTLLSTLKHKGVTEVCFCGAIARPQIDPTQIDTATMPLVPVIAAAVAGGEDSALRAVIGVFEQAGFLVRATHDLAPDLIPPTGILTRTMVHEDAQADVAVALRVSAAQGAEDLGQACVIRGGAVLAREDARGTDAMLEALVGGASPLTGDGEPVADMMDMAGDLLGSAADWLSGDTLPAVARGGLLFKAPKPGQDTRIDLPTIGPRTVDLSVAAGLRGIVIAAGGVMVLDRPRVVETLNAAGLFLWVR
jgi:hypothetical protein